MFFDVRHCSWILILCLSTGVAGRNFTKEASDGYYHCPFVFSNDENVAVHTALSCIHGCCGTINKQICCNKFTLHVEEVLPYNGLNLTPYIISVTFWCLLTGPTLICIIWRTVKSVKVGFMMNRYSRAVHIRNMRELKRLGTSEEAEPAPAQVSRF